MAENGLEKIDPSSERISDEYSLLNSEEEDASGFGSFTLEVYYSSGTRVTTSDAFKFLFCRNLGVFRIFWHLRCRRDSVV